ncbi:MAG: phosphatase PAP2 family protein [Gammaproteobacteria bacterium]
MFALPLEVRVFLGLSIGVTLLFFLFPEIDLAFSGMFYEKAAGGFFLNNHGFHALHFTITNGGRIISLALLVLPTASLLSNKLKTYLPPQRVLWFLFLAFTVGPGLVVNVAFKNQFGRARPSGVSQFGGGKTFTPAFFVSNQCNKNCSFVCGDCSVGFATLAFALLARSQRKRYMTGALVFGSLIGLMRIMQGAHFLSDVIFSGVFTTLITYALYRLLKPVAETHASPAS